MNSLIDSKNILSNVHEVKKNLSLGKPSANYTFIIDNSFYPCLNGAYEPFIALYYGARIAF
jgi:hypothetical protein